MSERVIRRVINTSKAPRPIGPYSHAISVGSTVYVSGQTGVDPQTMQLVSSDVQEQTRQTLTNLGHVLKAAGSSFDKGTGRQTDRQTDQTRPDQTDRQATDKDISIDSLITYLLVVKVNVLLANIQDYHKVNEVYQTCMHVSFQSMHLMS
jgi:hypothetical protein